MRLVPSFPNPQRNATATCEYGPLPPLTPNLAMMKAADKVKTIPNCITLPDRFVTSGWARTCVVAILLMSLLAACSGSDSDDSILMPHAETPIVPVATQTAPATPANTTDTVAQVESTATQEVVSEPTGIATIEPGATATATIAQLTPGIEPTHTPEPTQSPSPFESADLERELDALVRDVDGVLSVALLDVEGTVIFEHLGDESLEAASIYKLPVMVEVFRQLDAGVIQRDTGVLVTISYFAEGADSIGFEGIDSYYTLETLLFAMIAQSSNVAAYALLDLVGNENVNATMRDLGLDGIEIRWSPRTLPPWEVLPDIVDEVDEEEWIEPYIPDEDGPADEDERDNGDTPDDESVPEDVDEDSSDDEGNGPARWLALGPRSDPPTMRADDAYNVVTALDVARLLAMIQRGEVVSATASDEMLDLLAHQQIPGGLAIQLPPDSIAHKTGYLEDGVVNDAGIIMTPSGPVIAVVLTEHVREDVAYSVMSEVGRLVYEAGSAGH
jgi:beta-lactamase class A